MLLAPEKEGPGFEHCWAHREVVKQGMREADDGESENAREGAHLQYRRLGGGAKSRPRNEVVRPPRRGESTLESTLPAMERRSTDRATTGARAAKGVINIEIETGKD